jgi:hypothetical protein
MARNYSDKNGLDKKENSSLKGKGRLYGKK